MKTKPEQVIVKVMYKTEKNGAWNPVDLTLTKEEFEKLKAERDKTVVTSFLLEKVKMYSIGSEILSIDYRI